MKENDSELWNKLGPIIFKDNKENICIEQKISFEGYLGIERYEVQ